MDNGNTFGMRNFAVFCFLIISTLGMLFNMQHAKMIIVRLDFSIGGETKEDTGLHSPLFRETSELTPPLPDYSRDSEGSAVSVGTCRVSKLRHVCNWLQGME